MKLDPETEIITTLGSKEGLANLASAITAPGDLALVLIQHIQYMHTDL